MEEYFDVNLDGDLLTDHWGDRLPPCVFAVYAAIEERGDRARRARARSPQTRGEDAALAQRRMLARQRIARLESEQRQLDAELALEAENIMEGDEEALQHWLHDAHPDAASAPDNEYNELFQEVAVHFHTASDGERLPHYRAVGARPPSTTRMPPVHDYYGAEHRAFCTAVRARRRMPRRGQRPDQHVGRGHRLGPQLWALVDRYRSWLAGSLDAAFLPSLNELLGLVLGPPGSGSLSFIDDEGDSDCRTTIDVRGDPQTQHAALHRLGWPSYPTASELVAHILDRLEHDWALRLTESYLDPPTDLDPHDIGDDDRDAHDADIGSFY